MFFVIGGAETYKTFAEEIDKWFVTEIPMAVEGADAFMPTDFLDGFKQVEQEKLDDELFVKTFLRK